MKLFPILRSTRLAAMAALSAVAILTAPVPGASAQDRIEMGIVSGGIIIGATGGSGTLYFNGQAYRISIGGLSVGFTLGFKAADVVGEVYNLQQPSDISGTYSAIGAGATLGVGASVATLVNGRGVELRLRMVQLGLGYSLALGGMNIILR